jgi:hypothetical protein
MKYKVTISEVTSYLVEAQDEDEAYQLAHEGGEHVLSQDTHTVEVEAVFNEGVPLSTSTTAEMIRATRRYES